MKTLLILSFVVCAGFAAAQQPVKKADAPTGLASDVPAAAPGVVTTPAKKQQKTLPSEVSVTPLATIPAAKQKGTLPSAAARELKDETPVSHTK